MRLFAGEEREGTLETLLTAPVQAWQLILGKYLAALGFFAVLWIPAFVHFQLFTLLTDNPAPFSAGSLFGAFLLIFLMGSFFIAIGCLASSLTSNPIIAAVVTIGILFIHHFLGYVTVIYEDAYRAAGFFRYISTNEHLRFFSKGLIDSRPILYYLTMTGFTLFVTHHVLNHRRWRA
jgi:ABC-2 type transport system permease protein